MKCTQTLKGHEHNVSGVIFTPSGDNVISSSWDKTIKVWDTNTGFCIATLQGHEDRVVDVAINDKGTMLASSGNRKDIRCWGTDWKNTNPTVAFEEEHENVVDTVVFAPFSAAQVITKCLHEQRSPGDEQGNMEGDEEEAKQPEPKKPSA